MILTNDDSLMYELSAAGQAEVRFVVMSTAKGTFEIAMTPGATEVEGAVGRLDFTRTFSGGLDAIGRGLMLSCGDPQAGEAGYVAIEIVEGRLGKREGGFALQQFGTMHGGSQALRYEVVPGSGRGALEGIAGSFHLTVEDDRDAPVRAGIRGLNRALTAGPYEDPATGKVFVLPRAAWASQLDL